MLVWATRTASALTLRALFYAGLFLVVVMAHVGITTALKAMGWSAGLSLLVSGAAVLAVVLVSVNVADFVRERLAARREVRRMREGLPGGPCCVVWRATSPEDSSPDMPWEMIGHLRARYPKLARRLGVEGVAVCDFEINAEGAPKNIHCVYAWPSDVFFEAARDALARSRFQPRGDVHPRFGASYRLPFVFRISGAAKLRDRGVRARPHSPVLQAATDVVEKLRKSA